MKNQFLTLAAVAFFGQVFAQTITNYTTTDGLLNDNVICVDVDAMDNIWFGTQAGVSMYNGTTWTSHTTTTDAGLVDNTIQAIYATASGDIWVGTDFGASMYDGVSWTTFTTADGLGNDQIKCITEDANGHIWFGTNSGASEYTGTAWTSYGTAQGLPFGGVNEIDVHSNGDIWMGTGLSGIRIYNGSTFSSITTADGLVDNRIRAMVIDDSNNKWIGTSEGITVLNSSNTFSMNHTTIFTLPPPDTLNPIEDIEMDSQGIMWTGVYVDYLVTEGGVSAYNGVNWVEYDVSDGLVGPVVRALAIDGNDDVWVATSTGVSKISDPTVGLINEANELAFSIYPNPASNKLHINLGGQTVDLQEIEMFDSSMKSISVFGTQTSQGFTFNIDQLSSGMYFVRIGSGVKKVVVR